MKVLIILYNHVVRLTATAAGFQSGRKYCICEGTACWQSYNSPVVVLEQSGKTSLNIQHK